MLKLKAVLSSGLSRRALGLTATAAALTLPLSACGGSDSSESGLTGEIAIDGSSTVAPFTNVARLLTIP